MKLKRAIVWMIVCALTLLGSGAMAVPVQYQSPLTVTGVSAVDGATVSFTTQSLQLLGVNAEGNYLIYANQGFYTVAAEDATELTERLEPAVLENLPAITGRAPIAKGAKGEDVVRLQQALIDLGYLEGTADGDFGGGTQRALQAYQADLGLAETGAADEGLFLLITSAKEQAVAPQEPSAQFSDIADVLEIDMEPIYNSGLTLEYDDMTGRGFISNGETYEYDLSGAADIDTYRLSVRFGLLVREAEDGSTTVQPAAEVGCLCVRRPVLTEMIMKSGANRGTADITELETVLEGVNCRETGVVLLNDKMVEALAGAAEAGELKLRLNGRYNTFDIAIAPESLASVAKIGAVAKQIAE